jgi:sialidase-1
MPIRTRIAIAVAGLLAAATVVLAPAPAHATTCTTTLWQAGVGGYASYRIPALVADGGTLVAFAEGRRDSAADNGSVAVVSRRSTDGGCTWSAQTRVAADGGQTVGNPVPLVTADGTLVLLTSWQGGAYTQAQIVAGTVPAPWGRRVYVQTSTDQGATWTARREITSSVKDPAWLWYATGPGHGLTLTSGAHAGRLVVAADHWTLGGAEHGVVLIYSDDGGQTWQMGADDSQSGALHPDEASAAQLPDGRIYISARDQGGTDPSSRDDTYSADSGATYTQPFQAQPAIVTPEVEGSVLQDPGLPGGVSCHPLLYSGPQDPTTRQHLTIRRSDDSGQTWRTVTTITGATVPAGYSDITKTSRTTLGVLYETGASGYAERIDLARVAVACP